LNAVFALAGGPFLQSMVDLVADPTGLLDGLAHRKDQAGDGHFGPLLQVEPVSLMVADPIAAAGFTEIGLALAGVDEHDGYLGLVSIALADHFGGGAELAGGPVDGGGGAESAQFELKNRGRMTVGKSDGIEFPKAVTAAKVVPQLRVLVPEDAAIPELEMTGKQRANAKLGRSADNRKGGRFDADLAGAFAFPATANGETFRPAEIFAVIRVDELRFAVIGCGGGRV